MTILSIQEIQLGVVPAANPNNSLPAAAQTPSILLIATNDTNATVTTAGYLNKLQQVTTDQLVFRQTQIALVYTTDQLVNWYQLQIAANGTITLVETQGIIAGNLNVTGTITATGNITSTTGNLAATLGSVSAGTTVTAGTGITSTTGNIAASQGNVIAGSDGHAGLFTSFAPGAGLGFLALQAANNGGNFSVVLTNASFGQSTTLTIPDPANAAARILVGATATPFTANHSLVASGTGGLVADAGYQQKVVAQAAVAGGAAAQVVVDAFCTAASMVVASWNDTTNPCEIETVAAGVGQFTVTSTVDPGASHLNYIITKV